MTSHINNVNKYLAFIPQSSRKVFMKQLNDYIIHGNYDSSYGDIVPMIIANAISISIKIFNVQIDGSQHDVLVVPNSSSSRFEISIHRRLEHFSALKLELSHTRLEAPKRSLRSQVASVLNHPASSGSGVLHRQQSRPMDAPRV